MSEKNIIPIPSLDITEALKCPEYIAVGSNSENYNAVAGIFGCNFLLERNIDDSHSLKEISEDDGSNLVTSSNTFLRLSLYFWPLSCIFFSIGEFPYNNLQSSDYAEKLDELNQIENLIWLSLCTHS